MVDLDSLIRTEDLPYEEDCFRNPHNVRSWVRYVDFKKSPTEKIFVILLPRSYKLWKLLLDLQTNELISNGEVKIPLNDPIWQQVNGHFEECLGKPTFTRRTFDRALKALPVTQHKKIWDLYIEFANYTGGDTSVRIWRRFLKIQPSQAERFVNTLLEMTPPRTAEAARVLTAIIESPNKYANPNGKTLSVLCKIIIDHPEGISMPQQDHLVPSSEFQLTQRPDTLDVELILRAGIKRFTNEVGVMWNSLAKWWILRLNFERARDVFEEGIRTVITVKDFTIIFDAYAEMEESVLNQAMQQGTLDDTDIDLRLARLERLIERRPFLISDVLLRQNPHSVLEWQNRIKLFLELDDFENVVKTYTKAVTTVVPHRANGSLTDLWLQFANFYIENDRLKDARNVFEQAVKVPFRKVDDLAHIWCQYAEMELKYSNYQEAINVLGRATAPLSANLDIRFNDESKTPQQRLFKSIKLWSFYVDLEESVGTVESAKAVYDRIMDLKIATPQVIINYAAFLEENKYFEESFRVYERGVELFGYPIAFEIWNLYLTKFIARYGGAKLERARDLFENALEKCPPKLAKPLYLLYAKLEEDFGLARNSLAIYDRGTKSVTPEDLYEMFLVYIAKATSFYGIVSTRDIYSKALEVLPDKSARDMAIKFAEMETKLGEIDRARAVLGYSSQICDPRVDQQFWQIWHEFEAKYGNEDTYKEMLRIKRSVQARFNSQVSFISSQILQQRKENDLEEQENNNTKVAGFVRAAETEPKLEQSTQNAENPDEIEIEESDEDEEPEEVVEKSIPNAVFGSLKEEDENLGAMERLKRKRAQE
ncbi:hypothetical protein HDV01_007239 [Terramyces sp. JEL0728]|nr:hypothetical protein HDV01_007239 [Terramyces sp. JEL0728]